MERPAPGVASVSKRPSCDSDSPLIGSRLLQQKSGKDLQRTSSRGVSPFQESLSTGRTHMSDHRYSG